MLPQRAAVAFVLAKVAVNGAVVERDLVVFAQVGAYLFGTEFAADKGVDVLNQLRIELIGLSLTLFDSPALPLGFFGAVLLPLGAVPSDFAADGAFVAVQLFGDFGDGAVAGQVLDVVSFALGQLRVAHGNLSCRKGRMLPHTGLFLLGKVALQMRIRRPFISNAKNMPSFPRTRESRPLGTEIYRVKRFLRFYVLDSRVRGNDGRGFLFFPIDSRGFSVTGFPRSRE